MRSDVPVLSRCCFCLPLRYGLLAWGYFKLIISILTGLYIAMVVIISLKHNLRFSKSDIAIISLISILMILDATLHVIFICGAHKKHIKFLRVYYMYGLTVLGMTVLLVLAAIGLVIKELITKYDSAFYWWIATSNLTSLFINLIMQAYVVLLVRSEIMKLKRATTFQFVNNAAEAECTMNIEPYENTSTIEIEKSNGFVEYS